MPRVTLGYQEGTIHPLWLTSTGMRLGRLFGAQSLWVQDHFMGFIPARVWKPEVTGGAAGLIPRIEARRIAALGFRDMRFLRPALLFGFGLAVCLVYGRRGFMPLDQSIVFDGGWRLLSGQVPFRDFAAPNGFTVHALQALFFAAFGVNWLSYCLHAAVVNGLFAVGVDRVLRLLGAGPILSTASAAASALVLYPPIGVPYMETHAFFFSGVALWLALEGRARESQLGGARLARWPWLACPVAMIAAALAKQVPSAFVLPVVVALALWAPRRQALRRARLLAGGSALGLGSLALLGLALHVDPDKLGTYLVALPGEETARRLATLELSPRALFEAASAPGLASAGAIHLAFALILAVHLAGRPSSPRALRAAGLAEALLAVGALFALLTVNQSEIGRAYSFAAAGIVCVALERLRAGAGTARVRALARSAAVVVALAAAFDAVLFHVRVNATRMVNDIVWSPDAARRAAPFLPEALAFLRWQVSPYVPYTARDLGDVASFLASREHPFLLFGDASVLYGLTGQPSVAPSLWFHPGLSMPKPGTEPMQAYERWLLERMAALEVRYVVLEGWHTWNQVQLKDLPALAERVWASQRERRRFGGFRVVDLGGQQPRPER